MAKVLVIGGTGTVGSATVHELLKRVEDVRVMTRTLEKAHALPPGVEGVVGSLLKPETLPGVLRGVERLFLITPLDRDETQQGIEAVDAAVAAGVERIVYLSVHHADAGARIPHFASKLPVEGVIKSSGVAYTILRPNNFYQNDLGMLDAVRAGYYPQPMGNIGLHRVDVRDIAEAAAIALTEPEHAGRTYSLVGPEAFSGEQTAAVYARHLGKPVRYAGDSVKTFSAAMQGAMPAWLLRDLVIMYDYFQHEGLLATQEEIDTVTALLRHAPRRFDDFVASAVASR